MIKSRFWLVLILLCLTISGCAPRLHSTVDERLAVLKTFESWNEGWNIKDAALAVADYAETTDWTNAFGDRYTSRADLQKGLEFIFSLDFVMSGNSADNGFEDVRFLADDIALVRSQLTRKGQMTDSGEVMRDRQINHLRVLHKINGRWLIVSHMISQAKEKGSL